MISVKLEIILCGYINQINKQHDDLLLSLINALRICNSSKINNPFIFINNVIYAYYCEKIIPNLLAFANVKHFIKKI